MLRRVLYEDWQLIFPVLALIVAAGVYLYMTWGAWRMKPTQTDRLSRLPLEDDANRSDHHD